jgi:hypothetical protein
LYNEVASKEIKNRYNYNEVKRQCLMKN